VELTERYKVVRSKRPNSKLRTARRRAYRKNKSKAKRAAKRNRRKPSFKRRLKRIRQLRKRMHIKPGSRRRLRVADSGRVGNMSEVRVDLENSWDQEKMLDSYLTTMLWSSVGDNDEPLDDVHSIEDISPEALAKSKKDIHEFCVQSGDLLDGLDEAQVGHDFWLTRCGHGAGFWDGDYEKEVGEKLTDISKKFGNEDPYVGDDKKIHIMGESKLGSDMKNIIAEDKLKALQDKIAKAQADGDDALAKQLNYELSDMVNNDKKEKEQLSPEEKAILANTGLDTGKTESIAKWGKMVEARKEKLAEASDSNFGEEFEYTHELEKELEKYGYLDDIEVTREEDRTKFAKLKSKIAKDLARTHKLFLDQTHADKYMENAKDAAKGFVEDCAKKDAPALKGKLEIEVGERIGDNYVGSGNGALYITLKAAGAEDVELEPGALHYSGSSDVVNEDMGNWNWVFWLASDDSPFQDSSWVDSYEYDRIGQALEQFAQTLSESDLRFELKNAFNQIERDLHLADQDVEEESVDLEFKHPKGVNSKKNGKGKPEAADPVDELNPAPETKVQEDTAGGEKVMIAAVERLAQECNDYLKKKGIKAPSNKMYKNDVIKFTHLSYDAAMTQKEDGKDVHYPEMVSFNIESRNTMKLSYLADGRIIREGQDLSSKGMTKEQLFEKVADDVAEWSNAAERRKSAKTEDEGSKKVGDYEIINHGVEGDQYFQGHGISHSKWDDCATGIGMSEREAYEDALEQLAQNGWEISPEMEADVQKASDKDIVGDREDSYVYISVDVKGEGPKEATESEKRIANLRESINEFEKALEPTSGAIYIEAFKTSVRVAKNLVEAYQKIVDAAPVKQIEESVDDFNIPLPGFEHNEMRDDNLSEDFSELLGVKKPKTIVEEAKVREAKSDTEAAKLVIEDLKSLQEQSAKLATAASKGLLDEAEAKNFLRKTQKYLDGAIDALTEDEDEDDKEWPLHIDHIKKAMKMVENPREWLSAMAVDKQLAKALELYQERGEYDGTLQSARECLELAAFEFTESDDSDPDDDGGGAEHEEEHDEPEEGDMYFSDSGPLGSKTSVSVEGKHIGEFNSQEEAEKAARDWMVKNNYHPNIWYISDHGNVHPYTLETDESVEEARVTTDKVAKAFAQGLAKKDGNNSTDGSIFSLHGNNIVKRDENGDIFITDAGWPTPTTRERINGVLQALDIDASVWKVKGKQSIQIGRDKKPWDGAWTKVGNQSPNGGGEDESVQEKLDNPLPAANRKMTHKDVLKVRDLKAKLAGMDRQDPEYDKTQLLINKILGYTAVTEKYLGFDKLKSKIAHEKNPPKDPGAVAASIGREKYGKEKFQKAAAAGKKLGEDAVSEDEGEDVGGEINIQIYADIVEKGSIHSGDKVVLEETTARDKISEVSNLLAEKLGDMFELQQKVQWFPGSDGKDGLYTSQSMFIEQEDFKKLAEFFPESDAAEFSEAKEVEVMFVLGISDPKKELTGRELKSDGKEEGLNSPMQDVEEAVKVIMKTKPLRDEAIRMVESRAKVVHYDAFVMKHSPVLINAKINIGSVYGEELQRELKVAVVESKKSLKEDSMSGQVFNQDNKFYVKDPKSGGYYPMKDQNGASKLVGAMVNFNVDQDKNANVVEDGGAGIGVAAIGAGPMGGKMLRDRKKNYEKLLGKDDKKEDIYGNNDPEVGAGTIGGKKDPKPVKEDYKFSPGEKEFFDKHSIGDMTGAMTDEAKEALCVDLIKAGFQETADHIKAMSKDEFEDFLMNEIYDGCEESEMRSFDHAGNGGHPETVESSGKKVSPEDEKKIEAFAKSQKAVKYIAIPSQNKVDIYHDNVHATEYELDSVLSGSPKKAKSGEGKTNGGEKVEAKDDVKAILVALNSTGSMGGKYPIGNKELTVKVKALEAAGKIKYDSMKDKWTRANDKSSFGEAKGAKWIIQDWAGNVCFGGKDFNSFDDAEEWLSVKLGDEYETDREEYEIVKGGSRDANYLDPKDPRGGKKVKEGSTKKAGKKLTEREGQGLIENHPEWAEMVKAEVQEAGEDISRKYETYSDSVEEVEHKSRDGFISSNDGGYQWKGFADTSSLMGSGRGHSMPKKAVAALEKDYEQNNQYALDAFKEEHAEEIAGIPEDKLNYHDLYDMGKGDLAEKLSELENTHNSDEQSTFMFMVMVMFNAGEDGGEHSMTVQAVINWEAPYHRNKSQFEDYKQVEFDFKDETDLGKKLHDAMEQCLKHINAR